MEFMIFAQATGQAGQAAQPSGGAWLFILPMLFMFVIFYFLLIRPQKKQEKTRQAMLKALQKNDKVVTIGGIYGVVANIREEDRAVTLKIDESGNVRIRVSRNAISRVLPKDGEGSEE